MTLLVLGHIIVFITAMAHDEIVAELVANGWLLARFAELAEIGIGLVLFLCWSALTVALTSLVRRAALAGAGHPKTLMTTRRHR